LTVAEARGAWLTFVLSTALAGVLLYLAGSPGIAGYPPMTTSVQGAKSTLQDVAGIALGMRRLLADMAWIQTLHYYGSQEEGQTEEEFENGMGVYPEFLSYCLHVARIDPYFTYIYYYGGAVLGWNLNRLSEAELLIREGITHNPKEWRLPQYLAGLAYQKNHDSENLIKFLETVASDPESPLLMKALLANIYKKKHHYDDALRLWAIIHDSGDPRYETRAREEFQEIQALMRSHKVRTP
jgi:hypothetical protein